MSRFRSNELEIWNLQLTIVKYLDKFRERFHDSNNYDIPEYLPGWRHCCKFFQR